MNDAQYDKHAKDLSGLDAYHAGREAYDKGERWISSCPYIRADMKEAWQAGFWARRSECVPFDGIKANTTKVTP